jgi:kynurenine formamidase
MPILDLSHTITDGEVTYPGLPAPIIGTHLDYDESRTHYAEGVEFHIGSIEMVANTGTYLDTPAHRWRGREGLDSIPIERVAGLPGVVVRDPGPDLGPDTIQGLDLAGTAVLFDTGWSKHWGTDAYHPPAPHVTAPLALALVDSGAVLVGIDSVNIDDTVGGDRPAHSILLDAGILIVEHLTGLDGLPDSGFSFTAAPVKVSGLGTFPVRAFASW